MTSETRAKKDHLKWLSLVTLTAQNALLGLSMRYATTRAGDAFLKSTAVLMAECVKLVVCVTLVWRDEAAKDFARWKSLMHETIVVNYADTLKVCVPSVIYLCNNNLLYVAAANLDVATYQITYQLKILTTAIFAVLMLKKVLLRTQWLSLVILVFGVVLVQLSGSKETSVVSGIEQNRLKGFGAALTACVGSGAAGIYFEKILKGSDVTVWMRNVQLAMLSIPSGIIISYLNDGTAIQEKGFFFGYDYYLWYVIALNALGGLLVAVVVKYADNILKGFATSLAILLTSGVSVFLFGFQITAQFVVGAAFVMGSIFLYGYAPAKAAPPPQADAKGNGETQKV